MNQRQYLIQSNDEADFKETLNSKKFIKRDWKTAK